MKGLLKNNMYATLSGARVFSGFMLLFGIFAAAVISQPMQIGYAMIGIVGFSVNAAAAVRNEFVSKWGKYKLILPVKRADIVKSIFQNQLFWLLIGALLAGAETGISCLLHGCSFDQPIDMLTMFALGISMSLFMDALFFPLFFLGGEERSEVFLVIALLCAFGIDLALISALNSLLKPGIFSILLCAAILLASSLLAFVLSYPLTVCIFRRKEY